MLKKQKNEKCVNATQIPLSKKKNVVFVFFIHISTAPLSSAPRSWEKMAQTEFSIFSLR